VTFWRGWLFTQLARDGGSRRTRPGDRRAPETAEIRLLRMEAYRQSSTTNLMRGGTAPTRCRAICGVHSLLYGLHSKPTSQAIHTNASATHGEPTDTSKCTVCGHRLWQATVRVDYNVTAPITLTSISSYTTTSSMSGRRRWIGRAAQRLSSG